MRVQQWTDLGRVYEWCEKGGKPLEKGKYGEKCQQKSGKMGGWP